MCEHFRKCAKCGVRSTEDPSLNFHRFPIIAKERPETFLRSRIWAKFVYPNSNYNDVKFLKLLYISRKMLCSRHFAPNSFISKNRLNKFSVPIGMEHILQKVVNEASSSNQFSVPTISSHKTESIELLSSDVSDNNSTVKQIHDSGKINLDDQKFEELSPKEKLLRICRRGLQKIYVLKQKRQQQNNLAQIKKLFNNDDFLVSSNLSTQPEGLELDIPKERSTLKQAPETGKHNLNNDKVQEFSSKEKLFNRCRQRFQNICVLKHKWQQQKNLNHIQNLVNNDDVRKFFAYKMSDNLVLLLQSQIRYYTKKPKRRHYNLEQQVLALTLYKKSPARYRLLRRFFSLPCQSMLKKLIKKVPLDAGINRQIFIGLADMVQMNENNENICTLMFNEMNIKRSQGIKIKSLVFMLSGVVKTWKQPIAYYMLANYTTANILVFLIKEVLEECFKVGLNIVATVCKISPVYIKALEMLGATKENPYFYYEQYEIVTILDPPHILKCFRDLFMEHDVLYCTDVHCKDQESFVLETAKWSHIQTFYEKDKMNSNFVFAPALTDEHIYPNKQQKTRVKLAAQIFSHSVAVGIMAKTSSHELSAAAVATANFLYRIDELFDALNADSKDIRRGKKYSSHLTNKSPHLEYLKKMKVFISKMRFLGLDTNPSCQEGWIRTINALEKLWHNLYQLGVRSLSTRRLNQDVLENYFACIRYNCGSNYNPTVSQFVAGIKTAVITDLKYCDRHTNCEDDTLVIADNLQTFLVSEDTENTSNMLESCQNNT